MPRSNDGATQAVRPAPPVASSWTQEVQGSASTATQQDTNTSSLAEFLQSDGGDTTVASAGSTWEVFEEGGTTVLKHIGATRCRACKFVNEPTCVVRVMNDGAVRSIKCERCRRKNRTAHDCAVNMKPVQSKFANIVQIDEERRENLRKRRLEDAKDGGTKRIAGRMSEPSTLADISTSSAAVAAAADTDTTAALSAFDKAEALLAVAVEEDSKSALVAAALSYVRNGIKILRPHAPA